MQERPEHEKKASEDRKSVILAAKAAGLRNSGHYDFQFGLEVMRPHSAPFAWNPLHDDGDALRLAVKLRITPHIDGNLTEAESTSGFCIEPHFDDPYAATRRAIVRAAAEIGKAMP